MKSSGGVLRSLWMAFFDGSPFVLDVVSDRFEVLLRRYHLFVRDTPGKFQEWLDTAPSQKRVFSTLESICTEMFPGMMSIASADFPHRWMLSVACVALKHHVGNLQCVELSECGRALRVVDGGDDEKPKQPPLLKVKKEVDLVDCKDVALLRTSLQDSICAASRTAALEVKVAELECRSKGLLATTVAHPPTDEKPCRKRKHPPPTDSVAENVFAYLSECRVEAMDALVALRKTHRNARRHSEKLSAAHAEICRLRAENDALQKQKQQNEPQPPPPASTFLPKRVLSLAGFWNLAPNDLLSITPALVQSVEQRGGTVVRRDGMQVCFAAHERALLIEAAVATMAEGLPQYHRRLEF
jgi:hypothetical protein